MNERRYIGIRVRNTRWQRFRIWLDGIDEAMCNPPPKYRSEFKEVFPGDPEWESATYSDKWTISTR